MVGSAAFAVATQAAIVTNCNFETVDSSPGLVHGIDLDALTNGEWDVYNTIPGWSTSSGQGIEIQTSGTLGSFPANSENHYVELDSHPGPNSNSAMRQTVSLQAGISYQLSFYFSPRESSPDTNGIDYSVGTALTGSVTGPSAGPTPTSVGAWTLIQSETFTVQSSGNYDLGFAAIGGDDTRGGLIDDVSISAVPLPAAAWLFGSALLGLGVIKRRRHL